MAIAHSTSIALLACITGLVVVGVTGCERSEEIRRYTVDKPPVEEPTDRTLAAIVPLAGHGWFFKLTGPKDAVSAKAEEFLAFLQSVHFPTAEKPEWKLPPGWQEQAGSGLRYATLLLGGEGKPLELAVTTLPKTGDDGDYLLVNINRWRGQLSLAPIDKEQLPAESRQLALEGGTATVVNLVGIPVPGGMTPPMMSGARDGN